MAHRPCGTVLLAGALLAAGLVGMAAFVAVLPRSADTSPLASLFALAWSAAYTVAAILTWRRSRLAPLAFLVAIGFLLFPASFVFPGSRLTLPALMVVLLIAGPSATGIFGRHVRSRPIVRRRHRVTARRSGSESAVARPSTRAPARRPR